MLKYVILLKIVVLAVISVSAIIWPKMIWWQSVPIDQELEELFFASLYLQ